jgi:hypothetical protein
MAKSQLNPGTRQIVKALTESDWPVIARLKPSNEQLRELQQFLHGFLQYHLGSVLKGRAGALGSMGQG